MAKFSKESLEELTTCDKRLIQICEIAIKKFDFKVICGRRGLKTQNKAYYAGKSKLKYPKSKHNTNPSLAVDIAPWPINWNDIDRFIKLGYYVKGIADALGIKISWGGDWKTFKDYPHFEIIP